MSYMDGCMEHVTQTPFSFLVVIIPRTESISLICVTINAWPQIRDPVFKAIQVIYTMISGGYGRLGAN